MMKFFVGLYLLFIFVEISLGRPGSGVSNGGLRMSSTYGGDDSVISLGDTIDDSNLRDSNLGLGSNGEISNSYGGQVISGSERVGSGYGTIGSRFTNIGTGSGSSSYGSSIRSSMVPLSTNYGINSGGLNFGNGLMRSGLVNSGGYGGGLMGGFSSGLPRMGGFSGYGGGLTRFGGFNDGLIRSAGLYGSPVSRFGSFNGGSFRSGGIVGGNYNGGLNRFGSFGDNSLALGGNYMGGNTRMFNSMDRLSNPISNNYGGSVLSTGSLNQSPRLSMSPLLPRSDFGGYNNLMMADSSMGSGSSRNLMLPDTSITASSSYSSPQLNPQLNSFTSNTRNFVSPLNSYDNSNNNDILNSNSDFTSQTRSSFNTGNTYGGHQLGMSSNIMGDNQMNGNNRLMRTDLSKMNNYNLNPLTSNMLTSRSNNLNNAYGGNRLDNAGSLYGSVLPSRSSLTNSFGLDFPRSSLMGNENSNYNSRSSIIYPSQSLSSGNAGTSLNSDSTGTVSKSGLGYDSKINDMTRSSKSNDGAFNFRADESYSSLGSKIKNSLTSNDADNQGQQIGSNKDSSSDSMKLSHFSMT